MSIIGVMTDGDLIKLLGGPADVAAALAKHRVSAMAVHKWKTRGIPWRFRQHVLDIARAKRVRVPGAFLTDRRAA